MSNVNLEARLNAYAPQRQRVQNTVVSTASRFNAQCTQLFSIAQLIKPIFIHPLLKELVVNDQGQSVNKYGIDIIYMERLGRGIIQDIETYRGKLATIYVKATTPSADCTYGDELAREISIAEEYRQWMESYITVVCQSARNLENHFNSHVPVEQQINFGIDAIESILNEQH